MSITHAVQRTGEFFLGITPPDAPQFCPAREARDAECRRKYGKGLSDVPFWVPRTRGGHLPLPWDDCPDHIRTEDLPPALVQAMMNHLEGAFWRASQEEQLRVRTGGKPGVYSTRFMTSTSSWRPFWPAWARGVDHVLKVLPYVLIIGCFVAAVLPG